ncbi:MAG: TCP-1/cpn60 chaperonin family protein, partial [Candidatus Bathycorpusculaceae bacterium]
GLDPVDIMVALRAKHESGSTPSYGVDVYTGKIMDVLELNVVEPLRVKLQVIKSATEAANMILKIDDLIAAEGIEKEKEKEKKKPEETQNSSKLLIYSNIGIFIPFSLAIFLAFAFCIHRQSPLL